MDAPSPRSAKRAAYLRFVVALHALDEHWASVRFSGQISETPGSAPTPFSEVWHLSKSVTGDTGWQVAGIQQVS